MSDFSEHIMRVKSLQPLPPEQRSYAKQLIDMKFSEAAAQIGYALAVSYVEYLQRLALATNGRTYEIMTTYAKFKEADRAAAKAKQ